MTFQLIDDSSDGGGSYAEEKFALRYGLGRSVDSETLYHTIGVTIGGVDLTSLDNIDVVYGLRISCERISGARKEGNSFRRRAQDTLTLIEAHHYRFHPTSTMPVEILDWQEVELALATADGCWVP